MIRVLLEGPILTKSGYGEHTRLVHKALSKRQDIELMTNPLNWGATSWLMPEAEVLSSIQTFGSYMESCKKQGIDPEFNIQIHVGIPNEFEKRAPYSVCVTAGIETDRVSPEWILKTNQGIDKLIVPSAHASKGFTETSYEFINQTKNTKTKISCACPVDIINYPVKKVEAEHLDLKLTTEFNFLTVALLGPRKNLKQTIEGFIEEFRNESQIGLVVKAGMARGSVMDRTMTYKNIKSIVDNCGPKKCKIYIVHGHLTEEQLHSLYTHPKIKAYVTTTHGEGYGLPIFESAYSGLPIVATDWSGQLDFLSANFKGKNKKLFAKVDYELKPVQKEAIWKSIITDDSRWAFPKEVSYKRQLRKMYENNGMYQKWAETLKLSLHKTHSLEKILDQYLLSIFGKDNSDTVDIPSLRNTALEISNVKDRVKFVKQVISKDLSQVQKIEFLKDIFKGEKSYVISCGPTLTDHEDVKIKSLLSNNLTLSIKQSFDLFSELVDFHVYNCANYKNYDYTNSSAVSIEASTSPYKLGDCDLKFFIKERDFDNSLSINKDFDSWTFQKSPLLRPYGPGIMYEIVFYTLHHLGVSEITTIGWDNKLIDGSAAQQHFYDKKDSQLDKSDFIHSNEVANNPAAVASLDHEAKITSDAIEDWYDWLNSKGIQLKIVSSINPASNKIERAQI